jgi:hypothetical protein
MQAANEAGRAMQAASEAGSKRGRQSDAGSKRDRNCKQREAGNLGRARQQGRWSKQREARAK